MASEMIQQQDRRRIDHHHGKAADGKGIVASELPPPSIMNHIVRPNPIRPTVHVAIPRQATTAFYAQAHAEGMTLMETTQANRMAQEWQRKWHPQQQEAEVAEPTLLDILVKERAHNPSLHGMEDDDDDEEYEDSPAAAMTKRSLPVFVLNPADRLSSSVDDSVASSRSTTTTSRSAGSSARWMAPQVKRRYLGNDHDDNDDVVDIIQPLPLVRPAVIRPGGAASAALPHRIPLEIRALLESSSLSPVSLEGGVALPEEDDDDDDVKVAPSQQHQSILVVPQFDRIVHYVPQEQEEDVVVDDDVSFASASVRMDDGYITQVFPPLLMTRALSRSLLSARDGVLHALAITQGDVDSSSFKAALASLLDLYQRQGYPIDTRPHLQGERHVEGQWLTLSKPSFFSNLGDNEHGDPMYTLGRMSFDMFSPTNLVCSLQGNFNPVDLVSDEERAALLDRVPTSLRDEVESGNTVLRTYHVQVAFSIEPSLAEFPNAPNKDVFRPIRGIMTTYGYSLPDPEQENRHSIWFTGGRIEPNDDPNDVAAWKSLFAKHPPQHSWGERAKLLAVKLLLGATVPEAVDEQDGSMTYEFTRPIGGHGMAYIDVLYLDESLRIVRGHRGTVFCFSRLPEEQK